MSGFHKGFFFFFPGGGGGGGGVGYLGTSILTMKHKKVEGIKELIYLGISTEMCESCLCVAQVSLKVRAICTSHRLAIMSSCSKKRSMVAKIDFMSYNLKLLL